MGASPIGIYGGFSDESCVLWDENGWMDTTAKMNMNYSTTNNYGRAGERFGNDGLGMLSIHQQRHRTLYTYPTKHAGVWSVHPYVTDGQSALVSACADGRFTYTHEGSHTPTYAHPHALMLTCAHPHSLMLTCAHPSAQSTIQSTNTFY